jgi:hypothetical protein
MAFELDTKEAKRSESCEAEEFQFSLIDSRQSKAEFGNEILSKNFKFVRSRAEAPSTHESMQHYIVRW